MTPVASRVKSRSKWSFGAVTSVRKCSCSVSAPPFKFTRVVVSGCVNGAPLRVLAVKVDVDMRLQMLVASVSAE